MAETTKPDAARPPPSAVPADPPAKPKPPARGKAPPAEVGGPKGLEPTRYGDWEKDGRCIDF
jgi:hypothetical protein